MKETEDLTKHTLHLREGDWDRLRSIFPEIPTSLVIRRIISNFVDRDQTQVRDNVKVDI